MSGGARGMREWSSRNKGKEEKEIFRQWCDSRAKLMIAECRRRKTSERQV